MLPMVNRPPLAEAALRELVAVRTALDSLEAQLVAILRESGYTWPELAEVLGLTPQGAGKRHRAAGRRMRRRNERSAPFIPVRQR